MSLNIDEVLSKKGLTKSKLSELLGKSNRSYVTNALKNPTLKTLEEIAKALEVPLRQLFKGDGEIIHLIVKGQLHTFYSFDELKVFVNENSNPKMY